MPEVTPTPYPTLNCYLPTPTHTPTAFVSVIATPVASGVQPSNVGTVDFTVNGTGLILVIAVGIIIAGYQKLSRRRK